LEATRKLTARLELWQMTAEFLDACSGGTLAAGDVDFAMHADWLAQTHFIEVRQGQYRAEPGYESWGAWAIVKRDTREMIGHIGFHTTPNAEYLRPYVADAVEFGFSVYPEYRSQGFATEASRGLIAWAAREKHQRRFVVSISPANDHSQAIARKLDFVRIAQWEDDVDGTEEVFLLEVTPPAKTSGE